MTDEFAKSLVNWTESTNSDEANEFMMALLDFDALDLMPDVRLSVDLTDYQHLLDLLDSDSFVQVNNAMIAIGTKFVDKISEKQKESLAQKLSRFANHDNRIVKLQAVWLICLCLPGEYDFRDRVRGIVDESFETRDCFDILRAYDLLFRMFPVEKNDISVAINRFRSGPELVRCSILSAFLASPLIDNNQKEHFVSLMEKPASDEIESILDDFRRGDLIAESRIMAPFFGVVISTTGK
ncbi:MAG: hypothetical protein AAFN77_18250 [Planctomycetota bacterium]